jgi:hypothetical protein
MTLFKITAKQNSHSNGLRLEKGMSVEVASKYMSNPIVVNGGLEVQEEQSGLTCKNKAKNNFIRYSYSIYKIIPFNLRQITEETVISPCPKVQTSYRLYILNSKKSSLNNFLNTFLKTIHQLIKERVKERWKNNQ